MTSWFVSPGSSHITFHHGVETIRLQSKEGIRSPTFSNLCKSATPQCALNPFLFNGHLQTIWTTLSSADTEIYYKRAIFTAEDPRYEGEFTVDFVCDPNDNNDADLPPRTSAMAIAELESARSDDSNPMLVVLHGLTGGSNEQYVRQIIALVRDDGWEACVVNARGCALSRVTSIVMGNGRATWDVRQLLKWVRARFPNRPLFGIGFSLGANVLTHYLGEEGAACPLKAAVLCSNPWNQQINNLVLQSSWIGRELYSKAMAKSMKDLFEKHADALTRDGHTEVERVRKVNYHFEFDRYFWGQTLGYPTEGAYYRDTACSDSVLGIRVPFFAINALDDPIATKEALPLEEVKQNPYGVLCTTSKGGHLGWFEHDGGRWFARAAASFLKKMVEDVNLNELPILPSRYHKQGICKRKFSANNFHATRHTMDMYYSGDVMIS